MTSPTSVSVSSPHSPIAAPRFGVVRLLATLIFASALWLVVAAACLCVGSTGSFSIPTEAQFEARIDVVLLASLVGAGLGAAGATYQAVLRNPLADPYLLGVSSGATLASYLWRFGLLGGGTWMSALAASSQPIVAFFGAAIAVALVLLLGTRRGRLDPVTLLLVGVIVNAICSSAVLFLQARWPEVTAMAGGPLTFLVGGLQTNLGAAPRYVAAVVVVVAMIVLAMLAGQLNVARLGEAEAEALGTRIHRLRWLAIGAASLMTAAVVSVSGPIGFVGLVAPHLARLPARSSDQRRLLPLAAGLGAALLALADAISRGLAGVASVGTVLPVGVLTGLLGGPFFLVLLWRRERERER